VIPYRSFESTNAGWSDKIISLFSPFSTTKIAFYLQKNIETHLFRIILLSHYFVLLFEIVNKTKENLGLSRTTSFLKSASNFQAN
jgi:hypothetical protein